MMLSARGRLSDALRFAAQLQIIDDLDVWNQFLNARNLSVHDYVGMDDATMLQLVRLTLPGMMSNLPQCNE